MFETKTVKNRLHIDIHSTPGGLDELVACLVQLGAARVREVDQGPAGHWWVMLDPEGNEFCVSRRRHYQTSVKSGIRTRPKKRLAISLPSQL